MTTTMTTPIDPARVHGQWRLLTFREQRADGSWFEYLGDDAPGYISYWPNGHMQVFMAARDRPRFRGAWSEIPDADKAACLDRMIAYAGRYSVDGDLVRHHVDLCWIPNWEKRDLVRRVSFPAADRLLLTTVPEVVGFGALQEVLWEPVR